jgi:hypothetical protein
VAGFKEHTLATLLLLERGNMIKTDNPELSRLILNHLSDKYKLKQPREGIHLSTLVYCLTRSFFDAHSAVEPTDEELMLFALGYGLQDVLTPPDATTPTLELEGIIYRPDMLLHLPGSAELQLIEVKTTRMSSKRPDLPDTWLEYIKGGCYIRQRNSHNLEGCRTYDLVILYLMGNYAPPFPTIAACRLEFEQQELDENWKYLLNRKQVYQGCLDLNAPPTPYAWCKVDDKGKMWECANCRYKMQCAAISLLKKGE